MANLGLGWTLVDTGHAAGPKTADGYPVASVIAEYGCTWLTVKGYHAGAVSVPIDAVMGAIASGAKADRETGVDSHPPLAAWSSADLRAELDRREKSVDSGRCDACGRWYDEPTIGCSKDSRAAPRSRLHHMVFDTQQRRRR